MIAELPRYPGKVELLQEEYSPHLYSARGYPASLQMGTYSPLALGVEVEYENGEYDREEDGAPEKHVAWWNGLHTLAATYACLPKGDGSLQHGIEINSPPEPQEIVKSRLRRFLWEARRASLRLTTNRRTGMHVHVNRAGFEDKEHLVRFAGFILEMPTPTLQSFAGPSRRLGEEGGGYCRVPSAMSTLYAFREDSSATRDSSRHGGHSDAVSLSSQHGTVEVRIFESTTSPFLLSMRIELCAAVREYTRQGSTHPYIKFPAFVEKHRQEYPALMAYIIARKTVLLALSEENIVTLPTDVPGQGGGEPLE